jgi:hypothetical protein
MASARLSKGIRGWIIGVGLCVWATGVGWLAAHYLLEPASDALGFAAHPSEPWWLKAHGAFAFLAIWTCGLVWGLHVVNSWGQRRRRWSGTTLLGAVLAVIATGYLLYYVGADRPRAVISVVHWVLGLAIPLAYLIHRVMHKLLREPARKA